MTGSFKWKSWLDGHPTTAEMTLQGQVCVENYSIFINFFRKTRTEREAQKSECVCLCVAPATNFFLCALLTVQEYMLIPDGSANLDILSTGSLWSLLYLRNNADEDMQICSLEIEYSDQPAPPPPEVTGTASKMYTGADLQSENYFQVAPTLPTAEQLDDPEVNDDCRFFSAGGTDHEVLLRIPIPAAQFEAPGEVTVEFQLVAEQSSNAEFPRNFVFFIRFLQLVCLVLLRTTNCGIFNYLLR